MSMPDNLTIYKVPFGEDGFLLSFIEPTFGANEEAEYMKMSSYNELYGMYERAVKIVFEERELAEQLRERISDLIDDKDYLKYKLDNIARGDNGPTT